MDEKLNEKRMVFFGLVLEETCPECKGAGVIQNPMWAKWWSSHHGSPPEGHWLYKQKEEVECLNCNGVGYTPTDLGQRVLDFLGRHFKKTIS